MGIEKDFEKRLSFLQFKCRSAMYENLSKEMDKRYLFKEFKRMMDDLRQAHGTVSDRHKHELLRVYNEIIHGGHTSADSSMDTEVMVEHHVNSDSGDRGIQQSQPLKPVRTFGTRKSFKSQPNNTRSPAEIPPPPDADGTYRSMLPSYIFCDQMTEIGEILASMK